MEKMKVLIESSIPYPNFHPGIYAVSREAIELAKELRNKDIEVEIAPLNGEYPYWVAEKGGIGDFLQNPVILLALSIPINILSNYLYDSLKNKILKLKKGAKEKIFIKDSDNQIWKIDGEKISKNDYEEMMKKSLRSWVKPIKGTAIRSGFPIYFEHTERVVAMGKNLYEDKVGLKVDEIEFFDEEVKRLSLQGKYKFSSAGIVKSSRCTICNQQYSVCNHFAKRKYNNKICTVQHLEFALAEVSIVSKPVSKGTYIKFHKN